MKINYTLVSKWMEYIRNHPENSYRFSECFWPSQLISKSAAIEMLESKLEWCGENKHVYIFGGWYGVFSQLLQDTYPSPQYHNIDIDPSCKTVFDLIVDSISISHETSCMSEYKYQEDVYLVINTSTEHVTQEVYDKWWDNVPVGTEYLIQGNNFFESQEHIRCTETLEEFLKINHLKNSCYNESVLCGLRSDGSVFYRYIALGKR